MKTKKVKINYAEHLVRNCDVRMRVQEPPNKTRSTPLMSNKENESFHFAKHRFRYHNWRIEFQAVNEWSIVDTVARLVCAATETTRSLVLCISLALYSSDCRS